MKLMKSSKNTFTFIKKMKERYFCVSCCIMGTAVLSKPTCVELYYIKLHLPATIIHNKHGVAGVVPRT